MKRVLISVALALVSTCAWAQSYLVVDTEKVFESLSSYTAATAELEKLGETRQAEIDAAFKQVEQMYNSYMEQRGVLTDLARQQREKAIIDRETEINKRQEAIFGPEGELMKRREALMKPIRDRVFKAISDYAVRMGGALVLDIASNPSVLYYSPAADKTQEIINLVK